MHALIAAVVSGKVDLRGIECQGQVVEVVEAGQIDQIAPVGVKAAAPER